MIEEYKEYKRAYKRKCLYRVYEVSNLGNVKCNGVLVYHTRFCCRGCATVMVVTSVTCTFCCTGFAVGIRWTWYTRHLARPCRFKACNVLIHTCWALCIKRCISKYTTHCCRIKISRIHLFKHIRWDIAIQLATIIECAAKHTGLWFSFNILEQSIW